MKNVIVYLCIFLVSSNVFSQTQDTLHISAASEAQVSAARNPTGAEGLIRLHFDSTLQSTFIQKSLAQVLSQNSSIYIRQQAPGMLATISLRGSNAMQTTLMWNGFPIFSPMNGQLDLNLIPASLFQHIQIQKGGSGAIGGNAAIGGSILLSGTSSEHQVGLMIGAGSFGTWKWEAQTHQMYKKSSFSLHVFQTGSDNTYTYKNEFVQPAITQTQYHAAYKMQGLTGDWLIPIATNQRMDISIWLNQAQRDLPAAIGSNDTFMHQNDANQRFTFRWLKQSKKWEYSTRTALFTEQFDYSDQTTPQSKTNATSVLQYVDVARQLKHAKMSSTLYYQHDVANYPSAVNPPFYAASNPHQDRWSLLLSWQKSAFHNRIQSSIQNRTQYDVFHFMPLIPQAGMEYQVCSAWKIGAQASSVFRLPTLNEKYWPLMGNALLNPEQGWSAEINDAGSYRFHAFQLNWNQALYYRAIHDFVVWTPLSSFISKPMNIQAVNAQGYELEARLSLVQKHYFISCAYGIAITDAHIASSYNSSAHIGNQLIYTPKYKSHWQFQLGIYQSRISIQQSYTGLVYVDEEHTNWINPYQLWDVHWMQSFHTKKWQVQYGIQCANILDQSYAVMLNRPMPGRSFSIHVTLYYL